MITDLKKCFNSLHRAIPTHEVMWRTAIAEVAQRAASVGIRTEQDVLTSSPLERRQVAVRLDEERIADEFHEHRLASGQRELRRTIWNLFETVKLLERLVRSIS